MKREKARINELRQMPYAEYVQTPEWKETRKSALKRAGNRCQICRGSEALEVYHTSLENLGCEQEGDVLTLCETCSDVVAKTVTRDADDLVNEEEQIEPSFSLTQKSLIFLSSSSILMGFPALLHAPLPAELFGLGAAIALAVKSPKIYAQMRGSLPTPLVEWLDEAAQRKQERSARGEWNQWDRLLGRHMRPPQPTDNENEDEPPSAEPDEVPALDPVFPVYSSRVTLKLGKAIDREALTTLTAAYEAGKYHQTIVAGRRFEPHFNGLIGKGLVAAATQGSGKSILMGGIIEQAGFCGLPTIALDHKGEYRTVKELDFMNALLVGAGDNVDLQLKPVPEQVDAFVEMVFQKRYQAIVNLPSYGHGWLGKAQICAAIGQAFMRYVERQRQLEKRLLPCLVLLDEAQLYLPEDRSLLPLEAQQNKGVLSDLQSAFFALVSNGRSAGYTVGFATQSLTYLAKWAIKSTQIRIYGRHVEKNDLDELKKSIDSAIASREQIEAFPPGVAVVCGFTTRPMIVQFDQKQSRDLSETPGIERLHEESDLSDLPEPRTASLTSTQKSIYHTHSGSDQFTRTRAREMRLRGTSMAGTHPRLRVVRQANTEHSGTLQDESGEHISSKPKAQAKTTKRPIDPSDLAKAFALWQAGASSVRLLDAAAKDAGYGWSNGFCRDLIKAMEDCKLIPKRKADVL